MSVVILDDCIILRDGTYLCYDRDRKKYYEFSKKEVDIGSISNYDMSRLLKRIAEKEKDNE